MNSIWNKNFHLLKQRFPDFYEIFYPQLISSIPNLKDIEELKEDEKIEFPCGWTVAKSKTGDLTAFENGVALHSKYNPRQEALRLADSLSSEESKSAFAFMGIGLGYTPVIFAKNNPDKIVLVIEPDIAFFVVALYCIDFSSFFSLQNIILLVGAPTDAIISVMEHIGLEKCHFVRNKAFSMHNKSFFDSLDTLLERNRSKHDINQRTLERFAELWRKNSCKNLDYIASLDGINRYKDRAKNIPACVLAAGPSLEEMLPYLSEIKKRCLLICVDTALRSCLRVGVEPDFIVLVDPQYWNSRHIADLASPSSVLITELATYPAVFRFNCKEKILCSSLYPIGKMLENFCGEKGLIGAGGSVATTAWDFARYCGCPKIFLAGLDLGFPEKKTHAKGSLFEEKSHTVSNRIKPIDTASCVALHSAPIVMAKDYNQQPVLTDSRMSLYSWWFESKVASYPMQPTYSLTHKSVSIPGIIPYNLSDLLNTPVIENVKESFFSEIQQRKVEFDNSYEKRKTNLLKAKEYLLNGLFDLEKKATIGLNLCNDMLRNVGTSYFSNNISKSINKLEQIDKSILSSEIKEIASLVFPTERQLEKIYKSKNISPDSNSSCFMKSKVVYQELISSVRSYLKLLS